MGRAVTGMVRDPEVVQEILHLFVAIGRSELGVQLARDALDLFDPVLPITHAVMSRMPALIQRYPALSARDLVHVAACVEAHFLSLGKHRRETG